MSSKTLTLQLALTGVSQEDKNMQFETWRSQINGEDQESNMQLIDKAITEDRARITSLEQKPEGVVSINGKTGVVSLAPGDLHAMPDTYTPPVISVDGKTGAVQIDHPVRSVNAKTGDVQLSADDVGAASKNHEHTYPVMSVNGKTGSVTLTAQDVNARPNTWVPDMEDIDGLQESLDVILSSAGVQSVNGKSGIVVLNASDVHAMPDSYTPPVVSVNGQTGDVKISHPVISVNKKTGTVQLTAEDVGAAQNDHTHDYPVLSVNGKTGKIVLSASDVNARPNTWVPAISDIDGLDNALADASASGGVQSVNGKTGGVTLTAADVGAVWFEDGFMSKSGEIQVNASTLGGKTYSQIANDIKELAIESMPECPVNSVNGKTGAISLTPMDIGIVYSTDEPSKTPGTIWLKPIE